MWALSGVGEYICHVNMYEAVQAYTLNNVSMQLQKGQMEASKTVSLTCMHVCVCVCVCVFVCAMLTQY